MRVVVAAEAVHEVGVPVHSEANLLRVGAAAASCESIAAGPDLQSHQHNSDVEALVNLLKERQERSCKPFELF